MKRKNSTPRSKKKARSSEKKNFHRVSNDKDIWKKYNTSI